MSFCDKNLTTDEIKSNKISQSERFEQLYYVVVVILRNGTFRCKNDEKYYFLIVFLIRVKQVRWNATTKCRLMFMKLNSLKKKE